MNDWLDGGEDQGGVPHQYVPWLVEALEIVSAVFDLFAIAILMLGAVRFVWGCVPRVDGDPAFCAIGSLALGNLFALA